MRWRGAALVLGLALLASCDSSEPLAEQAATSESSSRRAPPDKDPRIDYLLVPGARSDHYDVDTSDTVAILTQMMLHGYRDPLRRAREELGAMGDAGVRVARRIIDENFSNPDGAAHLRNAVDVLHRSGHPSAREGCLQLLRHRDEGLATLAIAALEKHGRPEDYDAVRPLFERFDPEFKARVLRGMTKLDARRAGLEFVAWIEKGEYQGLWDDMASFLADANNAEVVGRLAALWPSLAPRFRALLAAPCARAGDERALTFLREEVKSGEPWREEAAVTAMQKAGLEADLDEIARTAASKSIRLRAVNALATPEFVARHLEVLRFNLASDDDTLSAACLDVLGALRDPAALDRAIAMLADCDGPSLPVAMQALREAMHVDPALARRALDALIVRREPEVQRPLAEQMPTLQAIGQIPLEESVKLLVELSRTAKGTLAGLPAERWLIQQAGNVGPIGQRLLASELERETDASRRIDLIEGIAVQGGPLAVLLLVRFVESDAAQPYEILYAADRLTRMGTVAEIAPILKRVTLRVTHSDVRTALQSLLWSCYPGPR